MTKKAVAEADVVILETCIHNTQFQRESTSWVNGLTALTKQCFAMETAWLNNDIELVRINARQQLLS